MTDESENLSARARRTRRNILKMGSMLAPAVLAGAVLSRARPARAVPRPSCFLKGTKIQTAEGERKVEDLAIGDMLPTMFGGLCPVQWIGRYPIKKSDPSKPWVKDALPVRIARSAFAPDVPRADLYVTPGHALLVDGVLVPVEMLINGATVMRFEAREHDVLEFFHIKLESHDVIYAEGAALETLLKVDESAWEARVSHDSGLYRTDPAVKATGKEVQYSTASFHASVTTSWLVNTEGTIVRKSSEGYQEIFGAGTQADDGMRLDRSYATTGVALKDLDTPDEFARAITEDLADARLGAAARVAIGVGFVEESDAEIERLVDDLTSRCEIDAAAEIVAAETDD